MALRGRVGRHTRLGGRQCQNWTDDQQVVIALLNSIPVSQGGAGGSITGRVIGLFSSDAVFNARSRFEDKHFPAQRNGFVEPGGAMLKLWEDLSSGNSVVILPHVSASAKGI